MKQLKFPLILMLTLSMSAALFCGGCDDDDDEDPAPTQTTAAASAEQEGSPSESGDTSGETALAQVTEPQESAFTVDLPEGWTNRTAIVPVYDQKRPIVTAMSPGGDTLLFLGDPLMPAFNEPTPQRNANSPFANLYPMVKYSPYQPAKPFFTAYLTKKFGKMPGFKIVGTAPNPRLEQKVLDSTRKQGMEAKITAVIIAFDYRDNGKLIRSLINGMTMRIGTIWIADLNGVSSSGDPTRYNDLLQQVALSFKFDTGWQERERALSRQRHEATMAMIRSNTIAMTRRHEATMAGIQASAARHQARMDSLHAAGDARMSAWKARQSESDASHEQFLNYIKGENTVTNAGGSSFQVESGQDRYFRNKNDNTFVGTDSTKELEDLRKIWGMNPDDYENVNIKR